MLANLPVPWILLVPASSSRDQNWFPKWFRSRDFSPEKVTKMGRRKGVTTCHDLKNPWRTWKVIGSLQRQCFPSSTHHQQPLATSNPKEDQLILGRLWSTGVLNIPRYVVEPPKHLGRFSFLFRHQFSGKPSVFVVFFGSVNRNREVSFSIFFFFFGGGRGGVVFGVLEVVWGCKSNLVVGWVSWWVSFFQSFKAVGPNDGIKIRGFSGFNRWKECINRKVGVTTKLDYLENLVYHFFRQPWLVLGVKLMEINSNWFSR